MIHRHSSQTLSTADGVSLLAYPLIVSTLGTLIVEVKDPLTKVLFSCIDDLARQRTLGEGTVVSGHDEWSPIFVAVVDQCATTKANVAIEYNDNLSDTILDILHISTLRAVDIDVADT